MKLADERGISFTRLLEDLLVEATDPASARVRIEFPADLREKLRNERGIVSEKDLYETFIRLAQSLVDPTVVLAMLDDPTAQFVLAAAGKGGQKDRMAVLMIQRLVHICQLVGRDVAATKLADAADTLDDRTVALLGYSYLNLPQLEDILPSEAVKYLRGPQLEPVVDRETAKEGDTDA